jgi:hypothetical protein
MEKHLQFMRNCININTGFLTIRNKGLFPKGTVPEITREEENE